VNPQACEHANLDAVERSPEVLGGAWRFRATRVPVAALFEHEGAHQTPKDVSREAARWAERADQLYDEDRYEDALAAATMALDLDPESVAAWNAKANALDALGRFQEAVETYEAGLARDEHNPTLLRNEAGTLYTLGRWTGAAGAYRSSLRLEPENIRAWVGLGHALRRRAAELESLGAMDEVLALRSEALDAYRQARRFAPDSADAWYGEGRLLYDEGKLEAALDALERSVRLDRTIPDAWNALAYVRLDLRQPEAALDAIKEAIRLDPEEPNYYDSLGQVLMGFPKPRYDEAIKAFDRALTVDPDFTYAQRHLEEAKERRAQAAPERGGTAA